MVVPTWQLKQSDTSKVAQTWWPEHDGVTLGATKVTQVHEDQKDVVRKH